MNAEWAMSSGSLGPIAGPKQHSTLHISRFPRAAPEVSVALRPERLIGAVTVVTRDLQHWDLRVVRCHRNNLPKSPPCKNLPNAWATGKGSIKLSTGDE